MFRHLVYFFLSGFEDSIWDLIIQVSVNFSPFCFLRVYRVLTKFVDIT